MSEFRKISVFLLWALLLAAILTGFFWFKSLNRGLADPHQVLPESIAIIFECNNTPNLISDLNSNNKMWKEISGSGLFNEAEINLKSLDSLIKKDTQIHGLLSKKLCMAVALKLNHTAGVLYCLPVSVARQDKFLLKFLSANYPSISYTKRRYEGSNLYDISWKTEEESKNFCFTVLNGIMIGSFSSELVEESVRQFDPEKNLNSNERFASLTKTTGDKVSGNVFINYENSAELLKSILNPNNPKNKDLLKNLASFGALDIEISSEKLILNGFTNLTDSMNQKLSILQNQEAIEFNCPKFLPEAISFFEAYGFTNKELFFKQLADFMQNDPASKELQKRKASLLSEYNIDLDKVFKELIADEFGSAGIQSGRVNSPFFFMELKSQSIAEQQFKEWITSWALKNGRSPNELMLEHKIDNNNTVTVYKMPVGGIPSMVFGSSFLSPENDYFTFINNYLVFANSYNSLKDFIYQVVLGNTVASGESFGSLGENISSRSNFFLFAKPGDIAEGGEDFLNESSSTVVKKVKKSISKFNAFCLQFTATDNLLYTHVFISYSGVSSGSVNTVWESRIDSSTIFKPEIVINHLTREKEIFIQDQKNQVYLLSNAGIILWKQMLDGPMLSAVFQVDYYGNGKKQYLFSTRNKIYIIDRNGNPVEKFPVEMRSAATGGISLFDYDNDGTIRMCVPGEDNKIYMYNKDGKIIPGWQAETTDNEVTKPIQHFRIKDKDYIVAIDKYKFYILDRKGKSRVNLKNYFQVSSKNSFYLDLSRGNDLARIVTTDTSGNIMRVYFSGKVEKIMEQNLDNNHYFVLADLDGNQKFEFITASNKVLTVLSPSLDLMFTREFKDNIFFQPVIYKFSSTDNKIGIVVRNQGNIYLYNNNGSLYNGFPLEGAAPFSISNFRELNGRFNLIVGSKNNFLYNYSVK